MMLRSRERESNDDNHSQCREKDITFPWYVRDQVSLETKLSIYLVENKTMSSQVDEKQGIFPKQTLKGYFLNLVKASLI